jgi:anti-sigma factor RsiW
MKCDETQALLSAYGDRELDLARSAEVEAHLHTCRRCTATRERDDDLRALLRDEALVFSLPRPVDRRARTAVRREDRGATGLAPWVRRWWAVPLAAAFGAVLTWGVTLRSREGTPLTAELLAGHVRSLMVDHLVDVASSDQHTVKPWFNGKIDFAPPIVDLTASGFPLRGGRIDYIGGRPVAVAIYQHRQHLVNVFMWPAASAEEGESSLARDGYNLLHWTASGLNFWAVSDLNAGDLASLAALIRNPQ